MVCDNQWISKMHGATIKIRGSVIFKCSTSFLFKSVLMCHKLPELQVEVSTFHGEKNIHLQQRIYKKSNLSLKPKCKYEWSNPWENLVLPFFSTHR